MGIGGFVGSSVEHSQSVINLSLDPRFFGRGKYPNVTLGPDSAKGYHVYPTPKIVYDGSDYSFLEVTGPDVVELCVKEALPGPSKGITKYKVTMGFEDGTTIPFDGYEESRYGTSATCVLDPPVMGASLDFANSGTGKYRDQLQLNTSNVAPGTDVHTTIVVTYSDGERTNVAAKPIHIVGGADPAYNYYTSLLKVLEDQIKQLEAEVEDLKLGIEQQDIFKIPDILEDPPGFWRLRHIPTEQIKAILIFENAASNALHGGALFRNAIQKVAEDFTLDKLADGPLTPLKIQLARWGFEGYEFSLNKATFGNSPYRDQNSYNRKDYAEFKQFPYKLQKWHADKLLGQLYEASKQKKDGYEGLLGLYRQAVNANACLTAELRNNLTARLDALQYALIGNFVYGGIQIPKPKYYDSYASRPGTYRGPAPVAPMTPTGAVWAHPAGHPYWGRQAVLDRKVDGVDSATIGDGVRLGTQIQIQSQPISGTGRKLASPATYSWVKLPADGGELVEIEGETSLNLVIPEAAASDSGLYVRLGFDVDGELVQQTMYPLYVSETGDGPPPVEIVMEPADVTVSAGRPVILEAAATSAMPLLVTWYHDGVEIPGAQGFDLVLPCVTLEDAGEYYAVVTDGSTTAETRWAQVTVTPALGPPPAVTSTGPVVLAASADVSWQITGTNNPGFFTASNLPPGCSLDPYTGRVTGKALIPGLYTSHIKAFNGNGEGEASVLFAVDTPLPDVDIAVFEGSGTNAPELESNVGVLAFPNTFSNARSRTRTFTIQNQGTSPLTGLKFTKGLAGHPGDFSITTLGVNTLAPNAATTFAVCFTPTAIGQRTATVFIESNDPDAPRFAINFVGSGLQAPPTYSTGKPDPGFGNGGRVTAPFEYARDAPLNVAFQSDGKIVVVGTVWSGTAPNWNSKFLLARYNPDGSPDTTLNGTGSVTTDLDNGGSARSVAIQDDGKILVAGTSAGDFALVRYNPNGTLDTSFNNTGKVITSFGGNAVDGWYDSTAHGVTIQRDGKILVVGDMNFNNGDTESFFAIARYTPDGRLDTTFNRTGLLTTDLGSNHWSFAYNVIELPDGKLLVLGESSRDFAMVKYNSDGSLDTSFGPGGKVIKSFRTKTDGVQGFALQSDGKLLVIGHYFSLLRFNPDGSLDQSFNGTGEAAADFGDAHASASAVAVQGDGKILVTGTTFADISSQADIALARFNSDGSLDKSFNGSGLATLPSAIYKTAYGYGISFSDDGKIIVVGFSQDWGDPATLMRRADLVIARFESGLSGSLGVEQQSNGISLFDGVSSIDYGSASLGETVSRTFTIRNTDIVALSSIEVKSSGPNGGDFILDTVGLPNSLAPGASATFKVTFSPAGSGRRSGVIQITSTDPEQNPFDLNVTGVGNPVAIVANYVTGNEIPLTSNGFSASGNTLKITLGYAPAPGTELKVINNTSASFIDGFFTDLAQGQLVTLTFGGNHYQYFANYYGGNGNDLVLVPIGNRAFARGDNFAGVIGDGTNTVRNVPVPVLDSGVLAGKTVVALAPGSGHSLALCSDGTLADWGVESITGSIEPTLVSVAGTHLQGRTVVAIAAGLQRSFAVCSDGTVAEWGAASSTGSQTPAALVTAGTALENKKVVSIAVGQNGNALALSSDGTIAAWGTNTNGQIGDGTKMDRPAPVAVKTSGTPLAGKTVTGIAVGFEHCLALCSDGTLASWGSNAYGALGDGTQTDRSIPGPVTTAGTPLVGKIPVAIAAGFSHNLALCSDGTLVAWGGLGGAGELGNGTPDGSTRPVPVKVLGTHLQGRTVVGIATGSGQSLALCSDGTLAAWGASSKNGNNGLEDSSLPVKVETTSLPVGFRFTRVFGGSAAYHNLATGVSPITQGNPLTVTNESDSGPGSLRQAILDANANADANLIKFAITPLNGSVKTIRPASALPAITAPVTIDGYTQAGASPNTNPLFGGFNTQLRVEIDGSGAGPDVNGIEIAEAASGCVIRGLAINRFNGKFTGDIDTGSAIVLLSDQNVVEGNFLGTNPTGLSAQPNGYAGVQIHQASFNTVRNNLISGCWTALNIQEGNDVAMGNIVEGNLMGTNAAGNLAIPNTGANGVVRMSRATNNVLVSNVVSAHLDENNSGRGLGLANESNGNRVVGNRIGTTADGAAVLGNHSDGIEINGQSSDNLIADNLIAGNSGFGIQMRGKPQRNVVQGNKIGTDVTGLLNRDAANRSFGNGQHGIFLFGSSPLSNIEIGGVESGEGNIIANNGGAGVRVDPGFDGVSILGNSIFANTGLGIDLINSVNDVEVEGLSPNDPNDADTGANNLQNFPVLTSAEATSGNITIQGSLTSQPNQPYRLEFFSSDGLNGNGTAQGKTFLGATDVTTAGTGTASFASTFPPATGAFITATATNLNSLDTSEFSPHLTSANLNPEIAVYEGIGVSGVQRQDNSGVFSFVNTNIGSSSPAQTFTIKNVGTANLTGLAVSQGVSGNSNDFVLGALGATTLSPNATTTFTVAFSPKGSGARSAVVNIASNDADENPFEINVGGTGNVLTLAANFASGSGVPLSINGFTATGNSVNLSLGFVPVSSTSLTVVNNTSSTPITGTFANLSQGQLVSLTFNGTQYNFFADYFGGDGNDLVLVTSPILLDIDGDGLVKTFVDGFLMVRFLLGITEPDLTANISSPGSRLNGSEVQTYLSQMKADGEFDIDGDGTTKPFTDGFLLLRRLLGLSGSDLVNGITLTGATRNATQMEQVVDDLKKNPLIPVPGATPSP